MTAIAEKIDLLSNATASTASWKVAQIGGRYVFSGVGTFDGESITLALLGPDGATTISLSDSELTTAGAVVVDLPQGANVKALVSTGGGSPTGLYATLVRVPQ